LLPVIDEHGKTVGTYEKLFEVTAEYLQERQSETIKKIEEYTAGEEDPTAFFQSLTEAVSDNGSLIIPLLTNSTIDPNTFIDKEFPFAMVYSTGVAFEERSRSYGLKDAIATSRIKLESHIGVPLNANGVPVVHDFLLHNEYFLDAVNAVCDLNKVKLLDLETHPEISSKLIGDHPTRGYEEKPQALIICPIQPTTHNGVVAIFVMGINPRRPYNSLYNSFANSLTRTISTALASVLLVNEQKRLAGKAAEMEQRALAMVEVSPVGSFLMDMRGEILYVNESVCRILNSSIEMTTNN
jgi:PAS domain-containing protein